MGNNLVENLDTINLNHQTIGSVDISGSVKTPAHIVLLWRQNLKDVIRRAGGYEILHMFLDPLCLEKRQKN